MSVPVAAMCARPIGARKFGAHFGPPRGLIKPEQPSWVAIGSLVVKQVRVKPNERACRLFEQHRSVMSDYNDDDDAAATAFLGTAAKGCKPEFGRCHASKDARSTAAILKIELSARRHRPNMAIRCVNILCGAF